MLCVVDSYVLCTSLKGFARNPDDAVGNYENLFWSMGSGFKVRIEPGFGTLESAKATPLPGNRVET